MFVVQEDSFPVCYGDWAEWRGFRIETEHVELDAVPAAALRCFCTLCWGQGRIMEYAANGEGLVPVSCEHCAGTGTVLTLD